MSNPQTAADWKDAKSCWKNKAAQQLGRLGGRVTSEAKAKAAKENGKKGGRPRKQKP